MTKWPLVKKLWAQRGDIRSQHTGSNCVSHWENWKLEECVYFLNSVKLGSFPFLFKYLSSTWVEYCGKNGRKLEILL